MKTIVLTFFLVIPPYMCISQNALPKPHSVYIGDRIEKGGGYCNISFVVISENSVSSCTYQMVFDKKIISIKKYGGGEKEYGYEQCGDSIIFWGRPYFNEVAFKNNHRQLVETYKLIAPNFLDLDNIKKMELLDSLAVRYPSVSRK